MRRGFIQPGANLGPRRIQWKDGMSGELIASGVITADLKGSDLGWLQINLEHFQQCFQLIAMPRHFGGGQWYFVCSELDRPASVLWRPHGALFFRCRQYWGRQAAYLSQFGNEIERAHLGRAKLKAASADRIWMMVDSEEAAEDGLGHLRPSHRAISQV